MDQGKLNEQTTSQLPALHLLQVLGYTCLTPVEAKRLCGSALKELLGKMDI